VKQLLDEHTQKFTDQLMTHLPERHSLEDPAGY
jgi:hypothetical protein